MIGRFFSVVVVVVVTIVGIGAATTTAHAQPTDPALAEQLFIDGQKLMTQGNLKDACPKLAESQRLDPKLGTLLNLATCHEQDGKLALAWSEFVDAVALAERAKRTDRVDFAKSHIAVLEKKIARVKITVSTAATAMEVRIDGKVLSNAALETALPIDPGDHVIEASANGKKTWSATVHADPGQESTVPVPALEDTPTARPPLTTKPVRIEPSNPNRDGGASASSSSTLHTVGYVAAGTGVVGLVVGSIFGALALSKEGKAKDVCPESECATAEGVNLHDEARTTALVSTIAFAAGTVLTAAGVVVILTTSSSSSSSSSFLFPTKTMAVRLRPLGFDVGASF